MTLAKSISVVNHEHTKQLIACGYLPDLLPIIPPGAELSPHSLLTAEKIGKTPGRWTEDGWTGYPRWAEVEMTRELLSRSVKGAPSYSLGMQARRVHALDVDTDNEDFAEIVKSFLADVFGPFIYGTRYGRRPGFLMPFRVATPRHKMRMVFSNPLEEKLSAVEILGIGQQYLVGGIHPRTGQPYQWEGPHALPETPLDARPVMPDEDFDLVPGLLGAAVAEHHWLPVKALHAPRSAFEGHSGASGPDMAPRPAELGRMLTLLPNRPGDHRDRDEWVTVCHALVGATGKSDEGRELFLRWSAQWDDSSSGMSSAERLWDGVELGQSRLGWRWLAQRMQNASGGRECFTAQDDFDELTVELDTGPELDPSNPFDDAEAQRPTLDEINLAIGLLQPDDRPDDLINLVARASLTPLDVDTIAGDIAKALKKRKSIIEKMIATAQRSQPHLISDPGKRLSRAYLDKIGATLCGTDAGTKQIFRYIDGVWKKQTELQISHQIDALCDDSYLLDTSGKKATTQQGAVNQAFKLVQIFGVKRFEPMATDEPRFMARNVLNLANGTLWFHGGQVEFRKHNPDDLLFHKSDIDYEPRAKAPLFLKAVTDMLRDSYYDMETSERDYETIYQRCELVGASASERVEFGNLECWIEDGRVRAVNVADNMALLQELFGYALLGKRDGHALIVQGPGRNGKSELIRVVEALLGPMLFNRCSLESLDVPFQMVELYGIRTICDDDAATAAHFPVDKIKNFGETKPHSVMVKHDPNKRVTLGFFSITNCNSWPVTKELGIPVQQRVRVIRLNRVFVTGTDRAKSPFDTVLDSRAEMAGVLNWAVQGALAYLARGALHETRHSLQAKAIWLAASQAAAQFVHEYCVKYNPSQFSQSQGDEVFRCLTGFRWMLKELKLSLHGVTEQSFIAQIEELGFARYRAANRARFRGLWLNPAKIPESVFDFETDTEMESGDEAVTASPPPQFLN